MLIVYHLIIGTLIWFMVSEYWFPLLSNAWNWLNNFMQAVTYTAIAGFSVWSFFSCFDDKTLKETDLGHWTISGWLPKYSWAANLKNGPFFGVFTGLPTSMVSIKKIPNEKKSEKPKFKIQVEIYRDPLNRKFEAVFDTSYTVEVVDTWKVLTAPSGPTDIEKIFERSLTAWLNHTNNNYTDIKGLKEKIDKIQENVLISLDDAETIYGKKMSNPRVIDIQLPESIIAQQIQEAEEITDLEGFEEQVKRLKILFPSMSDDQISEQVHIMRGNSTRVNISSTGNNPTGGNRGSRRGRGGNNSSTVVVPVVTPAP
jgi:hypothetical protein